MEVDTPYDDYVHFADELLPQVTLLVTVSHTRDRRNCYLYQTKRPQCPNSSWRRASNRGSFKSSYLLSRSSIDGV
jgi:hypothetical protein